MPVEVSLHALVSLADSRPVWPTEFAGLVAKLEDNPDERTQWKVVSDWCQERGETWLAKAFDWVARHTEVTAVLKDEYGRKRWRLRDVPYAITSEVRPLDVDTTTLAGCTAELAYALASLTEKLL